MRKSRTCAAASARSNVASAHWRARPKRKRRPLRLKPLRNTESSCMNIRVQQQSLTALESDLLVVPLAQGEQGNGSVQALDCALSSALKEQIAHSGFTGKEGEALLFPTQSRLPSRSVLLLGLGKAQSL